MYRIKEFTRINSTSINNLKQNFMTSEEKKKTGKRCETSQTGER